MMNGALAGQGRLEIFLQQLLHQPVQCRMALLARFAQPPVTPQLAGGGGLFE